MTPIVSEMPPVSQALRDRIEAAPRSAEIHRALLADIPAMNLVECGGSGTAARLPAEFSVAAWNVERCLFPAETGERLLPFDPSVVLLSEVDNGMSRTAQRNTSAEVAEALNMHFGFGVEFFEMGLGGGAELEFCKDSFNALGFHGNAILSKAPFQEVALMRLDDRGHWFLPEFNQGAIEQPRVGERMAVAAKIDTEAGPICVVSTHLESNADTVHRHRQFSLLLDRLDAFAPGLPILIGGDLNTGNHLPPDFDWQQETLFELAEDRGFSWAASPEGVTTRASLITPHQSRKMRLDWICTRGFGVGESQIIEAQNPAGVPLSDHECILAEVLVAATDT